MWSHNEQSNILKNLYISSKLECILCPSHTILIPEAILFGLACFLSVVEMRVFKYVVVTCWFTPTLCKYQVHIFFWPPAWFGWLSHEKPGRKYLMSHCMNMYVRVIYYINYCVDCHQIWTISSSTQNTRIWTNSTRSQTQMWNCPYLRKTSREVSLLIYL